MRLGIVTGLAFEARLIVSSWIAEPAPLVRTGQGPAAAAAAAEELMALGVTRLASMGLAGGLAPELRPGSLIVPHTVVDDVGSIDVEVCGLAAHLGATSGVLRTVDRPVAGVAAKAGLAVDGVVAVDMESAAVARVAAVHGRSAGVVRVIADPAERALPSVAMVATDAAGRLRPLAIAGALFGRPAEWPLLLQTAADARAARAGLRDAALALSRFAG
ncbi:MAG: adenosylhopane nucleosidase [Pseudomonadota bacterium]